MVKRIIIDGRARRTVTMREVAESAGVSQATVSYVLNRKKGARVSLETRQRVLEAAASLDYRPNAIARAMAMGRSRTIGVYVPHVPDSPLSGSWTTQVMRGIGAALHDRQYHLLLYGYRESEDPHPSAFTDGRVDGLIVLAPHEEDSLPRAIERLGFPLAIVGGRAVSQQTIAIDVDNEAGGQLAAEHLIGLGHRRIAHLAGPTTVPNANDRRIGFERAMQLHGIPVPPEYIAQASFRADDGFSVAKRILSLNPRPTAIFAANDICALGALQAAVECNLRVPEDVSVIGFDDDPVCELSLPKLSTMRQPAEQMGRAAADLLLATRSGNLDPIAIRRQFPAEIVTRESTAFCAEGRR